MHAYTEIRLGVEIGRDSRWGGAAAPPSPSPPSPPPTPASGSPEGMAEGPPPEGWDLKGGMPAALEGASDNCPELALVELTPEAFLLSNKHNCCVQAHIRKWAWLSCCCSCWWCSISAQCHNTHVSPTCDMHRLHDCCAKQVWGLRVCEGERERGGDCPGREWSRRQARSKVEWDARKWGCLARI